MAGRRYRTVTVAPRGRARKSPHQEGGCARPALKMALTG